MGGPGSIREGARQSAAAADLAPPLARACIPLIVQDLGADGGNGELPVEELAALHLARVQSAAYLDGQAEIARQ